MKPVTILSQDIGTQLAKDFVMYLVKEIPQIKVNGTSYKARPVFKKGDVVIAERFLYPPEGFHAETRNLAKEGAYVFVLNESQGKYKYADVTKGDYWGLTGIIFRDDETAVSSAKDFQGFDDAHTLIPADLLLASYLNLDQIHNSKPQAHQYQPPVSVRSNNNRVGGIFRS